MKIAGARCGDAEYCNPAVWLANGTVIINININMIFSLGISNFQICPTFFFGGVKMRNQEIPRLPRCSPICFPGPYRAFSQCSKIRIYLSGAVARWTWGINLWCTSCTSYDVPNCHRLHIYILYYINIYIYCIYMEYACNLYVSMCGYQSMIYNGLRFMYIIWGIYIYYVYMHTS